MTPFDSDICSGEKSHCGIDDLKLEQTFLLNLNVLFWIMNYKVSMVDFRNLFEWIPTWRNIVFLKIYLDSKKWKYSWKCVFLLGSKIV